jgi:hypothetical protein
MASQLIRDLTISVKMEALLFLPNSKSLVRSDNLGIIDKLIETSQKGGSAKDNAYIQRKFFCRS